MTDIRGFNQNLTVGRNAGWGALRMTQDGALYIAEHEKALSIEGRLFGAHFGTLTTPLTTPATTAITTLRPQAWLRIPDGTTVKPIAVRIIVESSGATTQGEIAIAITQNDQGNGTSSAGTSGPINLNTVAPVTSVCTARQLATGDTTAETNLLELKRYSFAASAVNQDFNWVAVQEQVYVTLRGPATLAVYIGGNAVAFYCQMVWAEEAESAVS